MNLFTKTFKISRRSISLAAVIWFSLAGIGVLLKISLGPDNIRNFLIFKDAFYRALHETNLYFVDPATNLDSYLYGPTFSILMWPFAILPISIGAFLWGIANAGILFLSIKKLPVSNKNQNFILLFSAIEMVTSVQNMQINCIIAALIIFSLAFVQQGKDFWATLFIATGFLIKLYGIVGIAFFFFSRNKIKFCWSFIFWSLILFCLPMLILSPSFLIHSYSDWYHTLLAKDISNAHSDMQNISVMGMLGHIFTSEYLNAIIILSAVLFYALPFFRNRQLNKPAFQLSYLAFALIGVVIFSSSAESPTYIIAVAGVAIWYVIQPKKNVLATLLVIFTFLLTSLSSTDLFPQFIRVNFIRPYSLKALPCFLVWLVIGSKLLFSNFKYSNELSETTPLR